MGLVGEAIERAGESLTWCQRANAASGWQTMCVVDPGSDKERWDQRGLAV